MTPKFTTSSSPLIRMKASELVSVIKEAREKAPPLTTMDAQLFGFSTQVSLYGKALSMKDQSSKGSSQILPLLNSLSVASPKDSVLKTQRSEFWGETFGSSRWEAKELTNGVSDISLVLPLPKLT